MKRFLLFFIFLILPMLLSATIADIGRNQGELYGECYLNKTCNEGLVCDTENNVCIKDNNDSANTDQTDTADTDSGDSATDDNTDSVDDYTDNDAANTDSDDIDSDSTDSDNSKPTPIKNSSGCSLLTVD